VPTKAHGQKPFSMDNENHRAGTVKYLWWMFYNPENPEDST
jgi:hypothetical protein